MLTLLDDKIRRNLWKTDAAFAILARTSTVASPSPYLYPISLYPALFQSTTYCERPLGSGIQVADRTWAAGKNNYGLESFPFQYALQTCLEKLTFIGFLWLFIVGFRLFSVFDSLKTASLSVFRKTTISVNRHETSLGQFPSRLTLYGLKLSCSPTYQCTQHQVAPHPNLGANSLTEIQMEEKSIGFKYEMRRSDSCWRPYISACRQ